MALDQRNLRTLEREEEEDDHRVRPGFCLRGKGRKDCVPGEHADVFDLLERAELGTVVDLWRNRNRFGIRNEFRSRQEEESMSGRSYEM
jgi:hypothetical protein